MTRPRPSAFPLLLAAAIGLCLLAAVLALAIGSVAIDPADSVRILLDALLGHSPPAEDPLAMERSILLSLRLPRALGAALTGAALSVSGVVMQAVLRNPLASSYTLGVSSGAALGAGLMLLTPLGGMSHMALGFMIGMPFAGFVGGLLTVLLVLALAGRIDRSLSNNTIVLMGMVVSLFVSGVLTILVTLRRESMEALVFWQLGSFSAFRYDEALLLAILLAVVFLLMLSQAPGLDLLTFGEEEARAMGAEPRRLKPVLLLLCSLLTGTAIAFAGIIGFVDLVAPHLVRRLTGPAHRRVLPLSALVGATLMLLADLLSRTLFSPRELPVGAITSLIGGPFFVWIYFRRRRPVT
ncbi:MAG: iron ABC transporter permease [Bacillota bacterium]|nr:iron ABC transporter permease [Bacillota bacterium]